MDGAQDFHRAFGIGDGVPIRASSTGPSFPAAQRGPKFQVEGTTSWKFSILPSLMLIQWLKRAAGGVHEADALVAARGIFQSW